MNFKSFIKKYGLYLIRWQLSTPILAIVLVWLNDWNVTIATIIANLIGGLIFFWVDKFIFKEIYLNPQWEIKEDTTCYECGKEHITGYRITLWNKYNRLNDKEPHFRCIDCAMRKMKNERY